jgi:uncharacterized protein YfeS
MNISIGVHTYNTYGANSSISLVGQFFEFGSPHFGKAIEDLEIHVYFKGGFAKASLESLFNQYHEFISQLPNTKFYRKKNKIVIGYLSELGDSEIVNGFGAAKFGLFVDSAKEIASQLKIIKTKIKKSDDFNYEEFMLFVGNKIDQLPENELVFSKLQETLATERKIKLESMDEWEKLGVDWGEFHPNSRLILNSTFFWECANDFSPNGNDTGADVLSFYQVWRKNNRKKSVATFFNKVMKDWGVDISSVEKDDFSRETYEQSIIGLAFAQLKVDGACDSGICLLALEAIEESRNRYTKHHRDWEFYNERIRTLLQIEDKLKQNA